MVAGDGKVNGKAWINTAWFKKLVELMSQEARAPPEVIQKVVGLLLGLMLSHEIIGHELRKAKDEILVIEDVDLTIKFLKSHGLALEWLISILEQLSKPSPGQNDFIGLLKKQLTADVGGVNLNPSNLALNINNNAKEVQIG